MVFWILTSKLIPYAWIDGNLMFVQLTELCRTSALSGRNQQKAIIAREVDRNPGVDR